MPVFIVGKPFHYLVLINELNLWYSTSTFLIFPHFVEKRKTLKYPLFKGLLYFYWLWKALLKIVIFTHFSTVESVVENLCTFSPQIHFVENCGKLIKNLYLSTVSLFLVVDCGKLSKIQLKIVEKWWYYIFTFIG